MLLEKNISSSALLTYYINFSAFSQSGVFFKMFIKKKKTNKKDSFLVKTLFTQSINQSINRLMYPIAGINLNYRKGQRQQTYLALVFNSNKVIKTSCAA